MQWQQLQQAYITLKNNLEQLAKYKKQKQLLDKQIVHAKAQITALEQELNAIRVRLEKNEQFSFLTFVRSLTGRKQKLMEESLSEAMTLELRLVETQLMLEDLQDDQIDIVYKLNAIHEVHLVGELEAVEQKKRDWLLQHESPLAVKLNDLTEEYTALKRLSKELAEAYLAAEQTIEPLEQAIASLKTAQSYSTWDTFFGGGFIVTAMKHDKIEASQGNLHKVQIALQRLQNELVDIETWSKMSYKIELEGFVKFADYFFDDIFSAWSIHAKLATSVEQLKRVLDDVYSTRVYLASKMEETKGRLKTIEQEEQQIYMMDATIF
ncbi:MAG: hypothetical protein ABS949_07080 [Solibacillus sp.]